MSDNPFRVDPIIPKLLMKADVDSLKILRKMDVKWDHFAVKELEKRASKLLLKPVDFSCGEDKEDFESFLEDTNSNSQLFQSFKFFYPGLEFFNFYFLSGYTPKFIGLKIDEAFNFTVRDIKYLHNFIKMIGPELQELEIEVFKTSRDDSSTDEEGEKAILSLPPMSGKQLAFPKLTKFSLKNHPSCGDDYSELINLFKFILDKSFINLEIDSIIYNLFNAIGLDPLTPTALNRWTHLTHLDIHTINELFVEQLASTLISLGEAGMSLEQLNMPIYGPCIQEGINGISINYTRFFHTQSKSLKILILHCNFEEMEDNEEGHKIRLPVFENLHTFKLKIDVGGVTPLAYRIFEMGLFSAHFPKLETLKTFNHEVISIMFPEDAIPEPISLRTLKVKIWDERSEYREGWKDAFGKMIRSVENFKCQGMILDDEEEKEIPWVESLKVLDIYEVKRPLKLGYLNNLRELTVIERMLAKPKRYLRYFDQIRSLNLSAITFKFKSGELSEDDKTELLTTFHSP